MSSDDGSSVAARFVSSASSFVTYAAFRAAILVARLTPRRVSYGLAMGLGLLAFYTWRGGRRRSVQNLTHVAGGDVAEARRLARRSFGLYLVYVVDFFRLFGTPSEEIERRGAMSDSLWTWLEERRRGNGIVLMTMHFGNWDLGAAVLALKGFPVSAIADEFSNERVNNLVRGSREYLGMKIIPVGRVGPGILRALRNNDVVAMLVDVPHYPEGGVEVEFFGSTIRVHDGPARIALRTGSSVVATTLPRLGRWSDRVTADVAPVTFEATGDREHDVQALTQEVFRQFEGLVLRHPDQWYIFRNLWVADRTR